MFDPDSKNTGINDTICAISTPNGPGAIGIVRISGSGALEIAGKIFKNSYPAPLSEIKSHSVIHGHIHSNGRVIDEVLLTVMKGPTTYTKEDTVEISGHGGSYSLRKILEAAMANGARHAEPGEFTKRAFLNGRLDLSQAESVIDVINAETERGLNLAINHLKGALSAELKRIKNEILSFYTPLEGSVDFPEEDIPGIAKGELVKKILKTQNDISKLIKTKDDGRKIRSGINLVIAGRANAGKSSLFNLLLDDNRSIVTHIPGTTRDVLEESLVIRGILFKISDTAGLRRAKGVVEKIGIDRTNEKIKEADIILYLLDNKKGISKEDISFLKATSGKKIIAVINKIDLPSGINANDRKILKEFELVEISVKEGTGIDNLTVAIEEQAKNLIPAQSDIEYSINDRQYEALLSANNHLKEAAKTVEKDLSYELIALDLKGALNSIGEITGENITEETLNSIFENFCIGK